MNALRSHKKPPKKLPTQSPVLCLKILLLSKWTATQVVDKEKHFLVSQLMQPDQLELPVIEVEIEAVHSCHKRIIFWRELQDTSKWKQGWV